MFKNYFKIAFRTLARQKLYSAINILSLSIGVACCTLILFYVLQEWRTDRFHEHAEDIYRVYRIEQRVNSATKRSAGVSTPLGPAVLEHLPSVVQAVRMRPGQGLIKHQDQVFTEEILYADTGLFDMFSFPLEKAASTRPLNEPQQVVLSAAMAEKYFGDNNPVGQVLDIQLGSTAAAYTVSGVAAPVPSNSSIAFDFVLPFSQWPGYDEQAGNWRAFNVALYVQLSGNTDEAVAQAQLDPLVQQYYGALIENNQAEGWWIAGEDAFDLHLQPLQDVHFSDDFTNMVAVTTNADNLYLLMGIGLIVLLLACANFMTLAVGRAARRAREVGVRKSLGAYRRQLAGQFWGEALLLSVLSMCFGVIIAYLALPLFNNLAGTTLGLHDADIVFFLGLAALTLFCSFLAGGYPALILAGFRPVEVLKGQVSYTHGLKFTRAMIVVQFSISIGLMACTLVMNDQLGYVESRNLGFEKEGLVAVDLHAGQTNEDQLMDRFRQRLSSLTDVSGITGSSYAFGDGWARTIMNQQDRQFIVYQMRTDADYLNTMGMRLVAGRNFDEAMSTDREQAVIINQAMARELGWDDPVGQVLPGFEEEGVTVIGVVENYHFQSLRDEIEPTMLHMSPALGRLNYALLRIRTDQLASTLASVRSSWQEISPEQPFVYEFMDERLNALYESETRWSSIMQIASLFALIIACFGLFGLATLSVQRRRKEIGVRRVLGASSPSLALLVSKDFARLVAVAFLLSSPFAYFIMARWLNGFAYHTKLGPATFLTAGGIALLIAVLTVAYQSISASQRNPIKSLRSE